MGKAKKIVIQLFVFAAVIVLAVFIGGFIGKQISAHRAELKKEADTKAVLARMQTIKVGDTIPDHELELLDGTRVMLSDFIGAGKTALVFFSPTCHTCFEEIERLVTNVKTPEDFQHFVFISSENPRLLVEVRDSYNLLSPVLYDHRRKFSVQFAIESFPFNIIINNNRQIEHIVVGELGDKDIQNVLHANQ